MNVSPQVINRNSRHAQIDRALISIDEIILRKMNNEPLGLLNGLGGSVLYFSNRFLQTQHQDFQNHALGKLEKIIENANFYSLPTNFNLAHPLAAPYWIIDQLIKQDLLDVSERIDSSSVMDLINGSTTAAQLTSNSHDLFYGFIGNAILLIENDPERAEAFVRKILKTLKENAVHDTVGIYWRTPDIFSGSPPYEETLNFGIPHGSLGIILFLLKCWETYKLPEDTIWLLDRSIKWILNKLNKESNNLLYHYGKEETGSGRLGWCYGDQAIAFTLLRYYETFNVIEAKVKAYELIDRMAAKSMEQSGILFYKSYGYFDTRICHGTTSVAYMYHKMYHLTEDKNIKKLADKWIDITLGNLEIFFAQFDAIVELEKDNDKIDTSMGLLNGLSGVGLALISAVDRKLCGWDKLLLLDRVGRE